MDDGFLSLKSYLEMEPNGRGTVSLKVMGRGYISNYRSFVKDSGRGTKTIYKIF
jgi:hypothetical protein